LAEKVEYIGKKDVAWSYAATILMVGAGVLLFPFILHKMSDETVGVWNIFTVITSLVALLDFGFRPSFARNISYIFSGVKTLRTEGVNHVEGSEGVDYTLLKGTLIAMKRFYRWMALSVFGLLLTGGTAYFYYIMSKYSGDKTDAMVAWLMLIAINCYNLYTMYYDALLTGKGYVKRSQQIMMLGQTIYVVVAIGMIYAGLGLSAIVGAQLISTIVRRVLSYRVFFTPEMKEHLAEAEIQDPHSLFRAISPNAIKVGLTSLGGFLVNRSALLMGSAFFSLGEIASYGITMQVLDILGRCGCVMYQSYTPKLAQYRAENNLRELRRLYGYSVLTLVSIFIVGGACWIWLGDWALGLIHSDTMFVGMPMLLVIIVIGFLEQNHYVAAGFIMANNDIPFFIPSLVSGAATIALLALFLGPLNMGMWGLILAPGIAQLAYQNWKWPSVVIRELRCKNED